MSQSSVAGWNSYNDGITASWDITPSALEVGSTHVFQATIHSTKSPLLTGSPLFKPEVFTHLNHDLFFPTSMGTSASVQHPTEPIAVHFSADNTLVWNLNLTDPQSRMMCPRSISVP